MNWRDCITVDVAVLAGKPVVRVSRLAVEVPEEFVRQYHLRSATLSLVLGTVMFVTF
jgi:hypothetical protein